MIYDAFMFFNELDLLELRLRETEGVVDKWVIVEASVTHSGLPKPSYFRQDADRFAPWRERIMHTCADIPGGNAAEREANHRNAVGAALRSAGVQPDDIVSTSDLDEIPSADAIRRYRPEMGAVSLAQPLSYYWLNCVGGSWGGGRIATWRAIHDHFGGSLHTLRQNGTPPALPCPGGWHFSYLGGVAAIRKKLESFLHHELNRPNISDERHIRVSMATGIDLFDRPGVDFHFVGLEQMPKCVQEGFGRHLFADALFHERWSSALHLRRLTWTYNARAADLRGAVIEIGSWEGLSTVALANTAYPDTVLAVDHWAGSADEKPDHPTVTVARERDVHAQFLKNIRALTQGNVEAVRRDFNDFWRGWRGPIKFVYIDGSHDYPSVKRDIEAAQRWLAGGGTICGDDFQAAGCGRHDLQGGVERAVRELCPGFEQIDNLWIWQMR
ncbi:MAG: class I SAM-dependent methyltransferase [Rhodospirillales bacterium]|nr:class I SAM-dependent methyltransferase [Rhodospirillales bacterium]